MLASTAADTSNFVDLDVPAYAWVGLIAVIIAMLVIDLIRHREAHAPTPREALVESSIWVACGLAFGVVVYIAFGGPAFGEYISGYLIEKSLSVDNVFVWSMLFTTLAIPLKYQHRVLFWGIFGALTLRAVFIFAGSALIEKFWWLLLASPPPRRVSEVSGANSGESMLPSRLAETPRSRAIWLKLGLELETKMGRRFDSAVGTLRPTCGRQRHGVRPRIPAAVARPVAIVG